MDSAEIEVGKLPPFSENRCPLTEMHGFSNKAEFYTEIHFQRYNKLLLFIIKLYREISTPSDFLLQLDINRVHK
jgi:hypothetical protein